MDEWENECGVRFHQSSPGPDAYQIIRIHGSNSWTSSIGDNNAHNYMYYGDSPDPVEAKGHVLHELGHCIGLVHEHQRPDRGEYIKIVWDNIHSRYEHNFIIRDNPLISEKNFPYDYGSIMHYGSMDFSLGGPTIIADDVEIGQRIGISYWDAEKARAIYGPPLED